MDLKTAQICFFVTLIVLIIVSVLLVRAIRERDKHLFKLGPLNKENERLKKEIKRLNSLPKEASENAEGSGKKGKKSKAKLPAVVNTIDPEKIQSLESEITKLKERNYSLSQDNKSLRREIQDNAKSSTDGQKEIVSLRESNNDLNSEISDLKNQIVSLEKQLSENKDTVQASSENEHDSDLSAKCASLEKENAKLSDLLKDVRGELSKYKNDFKSEVDAAKKEIADSNRAIKKDLNSAQHQIQQSKKRADNNHQLYMVARAQLMVAEKKLQQLDPDYKSVLLPTSNEAIEEAVKKYVTVNARESRVSADVAQLNNRIKELEAEIASLKAEQNQDRLVTVGSLDDDDSLNDLVKELANPDVMMSDTPTVVGTGAQHVGGAIGGLRGGNISGLDLSDMDDEWESI